MKTVKEHPLTTSVIVALVIIVIVLAIWLFVVLRKKDKFVGGNHSHWEAGNMNAGQGGTVDRNANHAVYQQASLDPKLKSYLNDKRYGEFSPQAYGYCGEYTDPEAIREFRAAQVSSGHANYSDNPELWNMIADNGEISPEKEQAVRNSVTAM